MSSEACKNCGHAEEDHVGHWVNDDKSLTLIPGKLCYWAENQGYQQDLCPCPGFNVNTDVTYVDTLISKAGSR